MSTDQSHHYAEHSTVVSLASAVSSQLRVWVATSWLARITTTLGNAFDDATRTSRITAALRALEHFIRHSFCYRWLTAEPDPDVIVIDLRETYAVGPSIALLDRVQPTIELAWNASTFHRITTQLEPNREIVACSRTVRLLAAALEPPELPDETRDTSADEDDTDSR